MTLSEAIRLGASESELEPCWYHRFGGGEPCPQPGTWLWPDPPQVPGRGVLLAMRWCSEHKHETDVRNRVCGG